MGEGGVRQITESAEVRIYLQENGGEVSVYLKLEEASEAVDLVGEHDEVATETLRTIHECCDHHDDCADINVIVLRSNKDEELSTNTIAHTRHSNPCLETAQ